MRSPATLPVALLLAFLAYDAFGTALYVDVNNANPAPPYADWSSAATNIQDAIDAASDGDQILVTNGVYAAGGSVVFGSLTNRVVIDKAVTVQSVNGPATTIIQGNQDVSTVNGDDAIRCVYLASGATLAGFTLTNGATRGDGDPVQEQSGGGVWGESPGAVVSNCVIVGNWASLQGGGAMQVSLSGCVLSNNVVPLSFFGPYAQSQGSGGAAQDSRLNDCLLINNYAGDAGGAIAGGVATNCVFTGNSVNDSGGAADSATLLGCAITNSSAGYSGGGVEGCVLEGCAVEGNTSFYGGGVSDSTLTNCTLSANSGNSGGGALNSTLVTCTVSGNFTYDSEAPGSGGGASGGTLDGCQLLTNSATYGGGADGSTLNNCTLTGNASSQNGGGAESCTLSNCVLTGNFAANSLAANGGGADSSLLYSCILTDNWAGLPLATPSLYEPRPGGPPPPFLVSFYGGGAENSTLNNCTLMGNQAYSGGGGTDSSLLTNCLVADNSAGYAGGAENSTLENCTIACNSGSEGINTGGAQDSTLNNCIVYYNTNGGDYGNCTLNYCCTAQLPDGGFGNLTNEPSFVNLADLDFHLQSSSPCINSGDNSFVTVTNDLDGNQRIVGGSVDIGAYEYQTPGSIISYAWLQQYDLPTDGSEDYADLDGTGMYNWQKSIAGLDPTNPASILSMLSPVATNNSSGVIVSWQSVSTRIYFLQRSCNLSAQPAFSTIQSDIPGQTGITSFTDTTATNCGPFFYRIGVQ